nr:MAG TPA: hypothetical protein [Caudoviricetes sp.]
MCDILQYHTISLLALFFVYKIVYMTCPISNRVH